PEEPEESGGEDIDDCRCGGHCPQPEEHRPHPRGHRLTTSLLDPRRARVPGPPCEGSPLSFSFPSLSSSAVSSSHPLTPYGWDEDWAAAFSPYARQGLVPGRVVR